MECRPQVAHCPAFRKNPASGANCEAATDVGIHTGRRLDKVAGEKARQTRPLPVRAEARLTSQISRAGATFARGLLAAPARVVFLRGCCPKWNTNPKLHAVRPSIKNRLRVRIARRQPTLGLAADAGLLKLQAKRPAKPASAEAAPRSGLHPKFSKAGATFARGLLAAPARVVFLRGCCPERNTNPKLHTVRPSVKNRLRVRVARRQPTLVLTVDAGLFRLQAKRPAKPALPQFAPRSGLYPKFSKAGTAFARGLLAAPACVVFLRGCCPKRSANPKLHTVRFSVKNRLRVRIARRQPTQATALDAGLLTAQAKRPAKPALFHVAPRLGLRPK